MLPCELFDMLKWLSFCMQRRAPMCVRASQGRARPIAARETLIRIIRTQRCRHFSAKLPLYYRQDAVNSARTHIHIYGFKRKHCHIHTYVRTYIYIHTYIYVCGENTIKLFSALDVLYLPLT